MQFNAPAAATAPPTKLLVGVRLNGDGVKVEELIRRRQRREQSIRRPLPLLHGSHGLSLPLARSVVGCDGRVRSGDLFLSRSDPSSLSAPLTLIRGRRRREGPDPVVSLWSRLSLPPPLLARAPITPHLPAPSSPSDWSQRWWPRWRGDVTRSCLGSRNEGGDGGGKVGLLALDVALAFPQATTSQFPPAGETSSLAFPVFSAWTAEARERRPSRSFRPPLSLPFSKRHFSSSSLLSVFSPRSLVSPLHRCAISTADDALPLHRSPSPSPSPTGGTPPSPPLPPQPRPTAASSTLARRRRPPSAGDALPSAGGALSSAASLSSPAQWRQPLPVSASAITSSLRRTVGRSPSRHDLGAAACLPLM
ncbi:hypothetical protein DAI22_12g103001 [Oryza sativa Japonica Group]|nr:hypothetical protein DAI22_12g103001 [Oryza sativa Japonica Group]